MITIRPGHEDLSDDVQHAVDGSICPSPAEDVRRLSKREVSRTPEALRSVERVLRAAKDAEATAHGPDLREAFRATRYLLAGCRANGITMSELSVLVGSSPGSIRARSSIDGVVSRDSFARLTGVNSAAVVGWERTNRLPPPTPDERGKPGYPASALIALVLRDAD